MKPRLAILTIGVAPVSEILPFLTEHISAEQITAISLLDTMSRAEVMAEYGAAVGEDALLILLPDRGPACIGRDKIATALQGVIELLDNQGYDVILLMSPLALNGLSARRALLLETDRLIPPLMASMVEGHQAGIILPGSDLIKFQAQKWRMLENAPLYAVANPVGGSVQDLLQAGEMLVNDGADVLVLDHPGFQQNHREVLQKHVDVPVLQSNVLLARLAAELYA